LLLFLVSIVVHISFAKYFILILYDFAYLIAVRPDALRTILKEEGWLALYRGIGPGLLLVTHGAIQFTAYEELRKALIFAKSRQTRTDNRSCDDSLNSIDYAALGAGSKVTAILLTYPYQAYSFTLLILINSPVYPDFLLNLTAESHRILQVIRARLQVAYLNLLTPIPSL
jgi:hypothetical protein